MSGRVQRHSSCVFTRPPLCRGALCASYGRRALQSAGGRSPVGGGVRDAPNRGSPSRCATAQGRRATARRYARLRILRAQVTHHDPDRSGYSDHRTLGPAQRVDLAPLVWSQPGAHAELHVARTLRAAPPQPQVCREAGAVDRPGDGLVRHRAAPNASPAGRSRLLPSVQDRGDGLVLALGARGA